MTKNQILILNGALGVGKSTLAEALTARIDSCVSLDGDQLVAVHPPAVDELEHLHSTIALLVAHHQRFGYRHFVINHLWTAPAEIDDLRGRLRAIDSGAEVHCYLLKLPEAENLRRIERRASARSIDELEFERRTVLEERRILGRTPGLGVPLDVSAPPADLATSLLRSIGR